MLHLRSDCWQFAAPGLLNGLANVLLIWSQKMNCLLSLGSDRFLAVAQQHVKRGEDAQFIGEVHGERGGAAPAAGGQNGYDMTLSFGSDDLRRNELFQNRGKLARDQLLWQKIPCTGFHRLEDEAVVCAVCQDHRADVGKITCQRIQLCERPLGRRAQVDYHGVGRLRRQVGGELGKIGAGVYQGEQSATFERRPYQLCRCRVVGDKHHSAGRRHPLSSLIIQFVSASFRARDPQML